MPSHTPDPEEPPATRPIRFPRGGPDAATKRVLRDKLLALRMQLLRSSQDLADEALKSSGQDFSIDHMADYGSDNFEQDISLALLEGETELLQAIETAVRKIDGVEELPYGICEDCANEPDTWGGDSQAPWIRTGRLEVVPYTSYCVPHQEAREEG
jgi:RNA polymerase-binding transcription factor DksA